MRLRIWCQCRYERLYSHEFEVSDLDEFRLKIQRARQQLKTMGRSGGTLQVKKPDRPFIYLCVGGVRQNKAELFLKAVKLAHGDNHVLFDAAMAETESFLGEGT